MIEVPTYPKIETLYNRDMSTFKVVPGQYRHWSFPAIGSWFAFEKLDGMNIRLQVRDGFIKSVRGRTDNAQIPPRVIEYFQNTGRYAPEPCDYSNTWIIGEAYGAKINGNPYKLDKVHFRVFDVGYVESDCWKFYDLENMATLAGIYGFETAPLLYPAELSIREIVRVLRSWRSLLPDEENKSGYLEGVVCRPKYDLFDGRGDRLIWKLKVKDFA